MKREIFFAASILVTMTSCNPKMEFVVNAKSNLAYYASPKKPQPLILPAGAYNAKITEGFTSSSITLVNATNQKFSFKTNRLNRLAKSFKSRYSMKLDLLESEIGQPFQISMVKLKKKVADSPEETRTEQCVLGSHQVTLRKCAPAHQECYDSSGGMHEHSDPFGNLGGYHGGGHGGGHHSNDGTHCHYVEEKCWDETDTVTDYGSRTYRGNNNYYRTVTNLSFIQKGKVVATIPAMKDDYREFDTTDYGDCR